MSVDREILFERRHWALYIPRAIVGLLAVAAALFFYEPLVKQGMVGAAAFVVLTIGGILLSLYYGVRWWGSSIVLTHRHLVVSQQHGILQREVIDLPFEHIVTISYRMKGFSSMLVGYGELRVHTSLSSEALKLIHMKNPRVLRDRILATLSARSSRSAPSSSALVRLKQLKEELGEGEFQRLACLLVSSQEEDRDRDEEQDL